MIEKTVSDQQWCQESRAYRPQIVAYIAHDDGNGIGDQLREHRTLVHIPDHRIFHGVSFNKKHSETKSISLWLRAHLISYPTGDLQSKSLTIPTLRRTVLR